MAFQLDASDGRSLFVRDMGNSATEGHATMGVSASASHGEIEMQRCRDDCSLIQEMEKTG